jgi:hypothetical protein
LVSGSERHGFAGRIRSQFVAVTGGKLLDVGARESGGGGLKVGVRVAGELSGGVAEGQALRRLAASVPFIISTINPTVSPTFRGLQRTINPRG